MKYSKRDARDDWQIAVGVFVLNFFVVQYVLNIDPPFPQGIALALWAAAFSIPVNGGFLYFILSDKDDSKGEKRRANKVVPIMGLLALLSAGVAFGSLLFSIHAPAGWAFAFGCAFLIIAALYHVDSD